MSTSSRFARYLSPHLGSVVLAVICALVISLCEAGYAHIFGYTVDALTQIVAQDFDDGPVHVQYFHFERVLDGITITITDASDTFKLIGWILASILTLVVVKGGFTYCNDYLMARVGYQLVTGIRNELYERILFAPLGVLKANRTGDLMARVTDDVRTLQYAVGSTANTIRAAVCIPVFVLVMLSQSVKMTALALLVFPLLGHLINRFGRRIRSTSSEIQQQTGDISSQLKETLFGLKIIKSFTAEEAERTRFFKTNQGQYHAAMRRVRLTAMLPPLVEFISAIGVATVFGFGCWQVTQGRLEIGGFIWYIGLASLMFKPIKTIGLFNNILQQSLASAARIFYVLDFEKEAYKHKSRLKLGSVRGEVEFRDVSFGYEREPVVKHINFHAQPGEVIALVGRSGGGKTTLLNLLSRFYEVDSGEILIDGIPTPEIALEDLRRQIAIVPQDTVLFDATVMENIIYGAPASTQEAAIEAAKRANAHDFITQMPNGYQTQIGESGTKLSTGQQQRLSIARAILKGPPILVLDEATSALDSQSEVLVQASLENLMKGRTTFVIAHRLSTVVHADKILVLNDGQIVESGTHQELLKNGGLYQKLCQMQFRG